ncbi:MAG TPA: K(+)-transporting ATPase subunit F [Acidimicrobiales bacterium]|nr:K(+)-transporting ATPase subunit F [Acidimicrobiales bacterium]
MIGGIFGWAISGDDLVGIIMAVLLGAYLIYVLLKPERL